MNVSQKFQELRIAKGYSVYKLSKISEVSQNYIRTIEKGDSQPSVFVLEKLLACLGTTLSEFFYDGGEVLYPTDFERELVERVRMLESEKAEAVLNIAKLMGK